MESIDQLTDRFYELFMRANAPSWKVRRAEEPLDWSALEEEVGASYPPSFKRWYGRMLALELDCGVLRLVAPRPPDPLACLRKAATSGFGRPLVASGLLPFGDDRNDVGPLCFDTRVASADGEAPIVIADHELVDVPEDAISSPIFSSFEKLLACVNHLLEAEDPAERPQRIRAFARIDPDGALPAYDYWTDIAEAFRPDDELDADEEEPDDDIKAARVRKMRSAQPSGFEAQYSNLKLAESVEDSDPGLALETIEKIDDPSLAIRVRCTRARCLVRLGRPAEAMPIVELLAREWIGPDVAGSANQHLVRADVLELLGLAPWRELEPLRAAVKSRREPEIVLPDGDVF